jgi:hypothetical protein
MMTEVVVQVGGWEHECCGEAVEVNQIVDFGCLVRRRASGEEQFVETHHDDESDVRIQGRVTDISVVDIHGARRSIASIPSGSALRGFDPQDDGQLKEQYTGEIVDAKPDVFDVRVIANETSSRE